MYDLNLSNDERVIVVVTSVIMMLKIAQTRKIMMKRKLTPIGLKNFS